MSILLGVLAYLAAGFVFAVVRERYWYLSAETATDFIAWPLAIVFVLINGAIYAIRACARRLP